jgi:hypothetical protein
MPTRAWRRHQFKARHYATSAEDIFVSDEVKQARNDFPAFMAYISGHTIAHCHMEEWVSHWVTGRSNHVLNMVAGPNISILSPRGAAKSTVISYLVAWIIGHNPAIPIIYLSYKTDIALSRSRIIKRGLIRRSLMMVSGRSINNLQGYLTWSKIIHCMLLGLMAGLYLNDHG